MGGFLMPTRRVYETVQVSQRKECTRYSSKLATGTGKSRSFSFKITREGSHTVRNTIRRIAFPSIEYSLIFHFIISLSVTSCRGERFPERDFVSCYNLRQAITRWAYSYTMRLIVFASSIPCLPVQDIVAQLRVSDQRTRGFSSEPSTESDPVQPCHSVQLHRL